ncbi:MAG: alkene reductase [Bdellovibrionaceae bacterium]|nr:alkene reductase [Pseudobdellovibrionaceae bacterium]NUM57104.1 alkene reductase [Pseudobdellovibrionaceae bacterium]
MSNHVFSNFKLGSMLLHNRIVMAPMTRSRCTDNIPNDMVATYYSQRAEAGLIITEGTSPSDNGLGYARIPGLFTSEHVKAWKKVTEAVHQAGSRIFVQLMHCGRVAHPDNMMSGLEIVAPSPIAIKDSQMWTDTNGLQDFPVPEELTESEIQGLISEYVHSADLAMQAGFDGVELHGANGYLIDQFLNTASNHRHDRWGGSIENRVRFAVEVTQAVAKKIGPDKVGFRMSPYGVFNGMVADSHTEDLYERLAADLQKLEILYVHIVDHSSMGAPEVKPSVKEKIRKNFRGVVILSGGYDLKRAEHDLAEKKGDLFAFGRPFISNPKLVTKLKKHASLVAANQESFYTPGPKGYIDYPLE